ncbi:trihelix transcription factor GT-3b-like [Cucurbita moschata]|uniref:Trihelix transcription factor GT-3b-like n=1 Tax=Cucurbita moschata TaxID=3662 RepID=A0A6J1GFW6_CUCMO|nr:trihelix transcription factor GT-3b-like [Cucurbita moschata]
MENCDRRAFLHRRTNRIGVNAEAEAAAADRFPAWSVPETKELLAIREALDRRFSEMKQNRMLWISVAGKMKAKGFNRNDEQCKCKWKNLVTRYKGCETMDPKAFKQQFPFYDDLHAIFTARMQKNWWIEPENRAKDSKRKATIERLSSEDPKRGKRRREEDERSNLKEIMKGFVEREKEMERQWREAFRVREEERRLKEKEWRMKMEGLEREKMMTWIMWREKDAERREREEARALNTHAFISALLRSFT